MSVPVRPGLVVANQLNLKGYTVTLFDKDEAAGGLLRFGIPNFKLDKNVIDRRMKILAAEGIQFEMGVEIDVNHLPGRIRCILHLHGYTDCP